jgi:TPR repeat protein
MFFWHHIHTTIGVFLFNFLRTTRCNTAQDSDASLLENACQTSCSSGLGRALWQMKIDDVNDRQKIALTHVRRVGLAMGEHMVATVKAWLLRKVGLKWLTASMDFNEAGVAYEAGDYKKAFLLLEKSARLGHARAQYNLGVMYDNGLGVNTNPKKAFDWYRKAAEQGNEDAQFNLGVAYTLGVVVTQNYDKALDWYHKAAEQGQSDAQNNLGVMYDNGVGVKQDYQKAEGWYCFAIHHDNAHAQYNMGKKYARGIGVPRNVAMAYALLSMSFDNGMDAEDDMATLERSMSPRDFAQAKKLMVQIEETGIVSNMVQHKKNP